MNCDNLIVVINQQFYVRKYLKYFHEGILKSHTHF